MGRGAQSPGFPSRLRRPDLAPRTDQQFRGPPAGEPVGGLFRFSYGLSVYGDEDPLHRRSYRTMNRWVAGRDGWVDDPDLIQLLNYRNTIVDG